MNRAYNGNIAESAQDDGARASVIIPVWNGREYLSSCLSAVLSQAYPKIEVIAVDNGSTDGSPALIANDYPQVRLIRNKHNRGFAGGCNIGLRAAKGDILVLLNQDTQVHEGWLERLAEALEDPTIGVAGCKIFYPDGETIQHAGGWIDWPLGAAHHYGRGERDTGNWDESRVVEYVTGAAMAFRREVLERVGSLDEEFWPGYFEDVDFCFRVSEAGYAVQYVPDATLYHHETTSVDRASVSEHYQRGRLRFVLKHVSPDEILRRFVPAEETHIGSVTLKEERLALRMAYLHAMVGTSSIVRQCWGADRWAAHALAAALAHLHHVAWRGDWEKVRASLGTEARATAPDEDLGRSERSAETVRPTLLEEFDFESGVPVVGPLITSFRTLWYDVAARWAMRHLMQQLEATIQRQETVSQLHEARIEALEQHIEALEQHTEALERHMVELSQENAILAQAISKLVHPGLEPLRESAPAGK